jgi:hypothetical protein
LVACTPTPGGGSAPACGGARLRLTDHLDGTTPGSNRRALLIDGEGMLAAGPRAGGLLTSRRTWVRAADLTEPAPSWVVAKRAITVRWPSVGRPRRACQIRSFAGLSVRGRPYHTNMCSYGLKPLDRVRPAKFLPPAAVAELVDAQASGACVLRGVEVRILSAASGR